MKRFLVLLAVVALFAAPAFAGVVGSKHDLRASGSGTAIGTGLLEVCVVCHTPHQVTGANAQDPLWNHTGTTTGSFGVYASNTMNATPVTDIGLTGNAMGSQSVSMLCMSCHDGVISVLSMYNPPNVGAVTGIVAIANRITTTGLLDPANAANMGTSLANDHPVNFLYDGALATADGGLVSPAFPLAYVDTAKKIPLFAGSMQCASCHNVHDSAFPPFLNISNTASALCTTCHIK